MPFQKAFLRKTGSSGNSFGLAVVLESLVIVGILYVPQYLPADRPGPVAFAAEAEPDVIYYAVPAVHMQAQVPQIAPPGVAGRPGDGAKPEETPTKGSTASLGDLTVISKPLQPDNHHQTIIQPLSPPELRITQDVKLPNVIMGNLSAPRAPLTLSSQDMPKPVQTDRQIAAANAPNVADPMRNNALPTTANEPAIAKPQLPIEPLKPNQLARGNGGPGSAAPTPNLADSSRGSGLPFTAGDPTIAKPQLPMGLAKPVQQARGNGGPNSAAAPNLADPTRGDPTVLIAANEPTVAKPALPVAMQRPSQGQGGSGQGAEGTGGTGGPAAPNVVESMAGGGLSNFGRAGTGPSAPLIAGLQRPTVQGRAGSGQGAQGGQGGLAAAPTMAEPARGGSTPSFGGAGSGPVAPLPQMPGLQKPVQQARAGSGAGGGQGSQGAVGAPVLSDANGLMIIGVDPAAAGSQIAVPPGNRWGDFTIAPARGPGSPGGSTAGTNEAGTTGQSGSGGDRSVGVGPGGTGGGGGPASASLGPISVKGTLPGTSGEPLLLTGSVAAEMVYPLPISVVSKLRPNRMIVSAGSIGGGGLNVYGALACGKIYTIFLPMPGPSWTMQFCEKSVETVPGKAQAQTKVVQLAAPIVPPDPNEDSRFDFKRVPISAEKAQNNKMIVLKGTLDEEGSVQNLQVYQGVQPEMDQAAQLAFSRWKFKPAMQSNKPVSVEILVGIPAQVAAQAASPAASQPTQSHQP